MNRGHLRLYSQIRQLSDEARRRLIALNIESLKMPMSQILIIILVVLTGSFSSGRVLVYPRLFHGFSLTPGLKVVANFYRVRYI